MSVQIPGCAIPLCSNENTNHGRFGVGIEEMRRAVFKVLRAEWILTEADLMKGKDAVVDIWARFKRRGR